LQGSVAPAASAEALQAAGGMQMCGWCGMGRVRGQAACASASYVGLLGQSSADTKLGPFRVGLRHVVSFPCHPAQPGLRGCMCGRHLGWQMRQASTKSSLGGKERRGAHTRTSCERCRCGRLLRGWAARERVECVPGDLHHNAAPTPPAPAHHRLHTGTTSTHTHTRHRV
jgi:hypothetical protein